MKQIALTIAVPLTLLLTSVPTFAIDFRGIWIGDTCAQAVKVEQALGTSPRAPIDAMLEMNVVVFEDRSIDGQYTRFLYSCSRRPGIITRISIDVRTRDESVAKQAYVRAKAEVVKRLGKPASDSSGSAWTQLKLKLMENRGFGTRAFAIWNPVEGQKVIVDMEKFPGDDEFSVITSVSEVD